MSYARSSARPCWNGPPPDYLTDFSRGRQGVPMRLSCPSNAEQVAAVLAWCYERDVPIVPRGGGTGLPPARCPTAASSSRSTGSTAFARSSPELWRIEVEAGVPTGRLKQLVRESGLMFAPDPGAPEQSQIGGNIATNAGGPHAFKYGVVATG